MQKALVERLRILEHEKSRIEREGEQQRKQYERCLDDVAKQVVKAVLSQKVRIIALIVHTTTIMSCTCHYNYFLACFLNVIILITVVRLTTLSKLQQ